MESEMHRWGKYLAYYKDGTTWEFTARFWAEAWDRAMHHYPGLDRVETIEEPS